MLPQPFDSYVTGVIFAVFLWAICYECFVYCHAGTKLLTEVGNHLFAFIHIAGCSLGYLARWRQSLAVSDAIYASRWYEAQGADARQCVEFFMARSQQGVAMHGIFFEATLVTFSSVWNTKRVYHIDGFYPHCHFR